MARLFLALLYLMSAAAADVKVGQPAPEITLDQLLPGQPPASATLRALKGKAIVLEFWATWCGPCVAAIPHWNDLAVRFKDKPIVFLSVTDEPRAAIERFLTKRPIEGWVGLTEERRIFEDYGVKAIGRTFLIDAAGRLAADLTPNKLTAATLDDLLASRPIVVPPDPPPFPERTRSDDNPLSKPVFDVMIRPTTAADHRAGSGRGDGELTMRGATIAAMVRSLYLVPPTRYSGDALDDPTRYDVWISLPGAGREAFQTVARTVISTAFHLDMRQETRDTDVYVLTAPNGRSPALKEATPIGGVISGHGKGSLSLKNGSLTSLAFSLEMELRKPVLDETGIQGAFDIKLTWQDGVPGNLEAAVRALGLELQPARRPVEFVSVRRAN